MAKAVQGQILHHSHAPEATEGPSEYQREQDLVLTEGRWFHTVYCAKHSRFVPSLSLAEREEAEILPVPALPWHGHLRSLGKGGNSHRMGWIWPHS